MTDTKSFCCNVCNIQYKSYKSLWTHNKLKHEGATTSKSVFEKKESDCVTYSCSTCDKVYKQKQTLREHQKKCSGSKTIRDNIELEKLKIIALEKQQTILELNIKLLSLHNEEMRENQELKEEEKQERKEEKQRIENERKEEKQVTQLKLRNFLLDLNQSRIQDKFC